MIVWLPNCKAARGASIAPSRGRLPLSVGLSFLAFSAMLLASCAEVRADYVSRAGFVTLQFDDTHEACHSEIFPALEQHGMKASFGYITEISDLGMFNEPWKMQEIYQAGHEVQDHTTRHDYKWATHVDTLDDGIEEWIPYTFADVADWDSLCHRSRYALDCLGIRAAGWNQPGGAGPGSIPGHPQWRWKGFGNDSLYHLIANRYAYALAVAIPPRTAHLNLRGHNCPERFPFFNVPYVLADGRGVEELKTEIADAVAAGLWYVAVSHAADASQIGLMNSLVDWLAVTPLEILTCGAGVERIRYSSPDPLDNQLPQARMLRDLDRNGKPDGFTGECSWDTLATAPVGNARCLRVSGDAEFYCFGPELGASAFSVWLKSATASLSSVWIICNTYDFDGNELSDTRTIVQCSPEWARIDTLGRPSLLVDIGDEVDRLRFIVRASPSEPAVVVYPELMHIPETGAGVEPPSRGREHPLALVVSPNPVRLGSPLRVRFADPVKQLSIYDVLGKCLATVQPPSGSVEASLSTEGLNPGVFFVRAPSGSGREAKIVILR